MGKMTNSPLYTGERVVPWNQGCVNQIHLHSRRYAWALQFVPGADVVDLGCGCGYGSFMLSWVAGQVTGLDICAEAIAFAKQMFEANNLSFQQADASNGRLPDAQVYVAMEFLEHLRNPQVLIDSLQSRLVWSLPLNDASKFHEHAYAIGEARAMMGGHIWYQLASGDITAEPPLGAEVKHLVGVR